jgi:hypothetical protein
MPKAFEATFLMRRKLATLYFNFSAENYTYFLLKRRNISLFLNITLEFILQLTNRKHNVIVRHYDFPVPDAFAHVVRTLANR